MKLVSVVKRLRIVVAAVLLVGMTAACAQVRSAFMEKMSMEERRALIEECERTAIATTEFTFPDSPVRLWHQDFGKASTSDSCESEVSLLYRWNQDGLYDAECLREALRRHWATPAHEWRRGDNLYDLHAVVPDICGDMNT